MNATFDSDAPRVPPPVPPQQPAPPLQPPPPPPGSVSLPPPSAVGRTPHGRPTGPSVSQVLVGVGALLVVVAVGVFTAVTWSALGPAGQALVLVAATVGAGTATAVLAERGLRASAEAVGVVTAALGLATFEGARDLLLTGTDPWLAWALGCGIVASMLTGMGFAAHVRAPTIVALFLGQLCVPLVLAASTPAILVVALATLALAAVDGLLAVAIADRRSDLSALAAAFGTLAWWSSLLVGVGLLFEAPEQATLLFLLTAGAAAVLSVSPHPAVRTWRAVGAASGTVAAVLGVIGASLALGADDAFWFPVAVLAGGFAIWFPSGSDDRLVAVRTVAAGSAGLAVSVELARSLAAAAGPFMAESWVRVGWSASGRDVLLGDGAEVFRGIDPVLTLLALVAATGLLVRWPPVALAVGSLAVAASGVLLDLSVVSIVVVEVVLGVGLCLAFVLDRRMHASAGVVGLTLLVLAAAWSTVVAPALVFGSLLVMLVASLGAILLAVDGGRVPGERHAAVLLVGVGVAWLAGMGSGIAFGHLMAWAQTDVWLFAATAAMVGSLAGFALAGRSGAAVAVSDLCAAIAVTLAGLVAAAMGGADTLSLVLAGVTVTALVHTLRVDRFWPAAVTAAVSGIGLVWLRLGVADVVVVEAYALPLASVVGLLGWIVHRRGHERRVVGHHRSCAPGGHRPVDPDGAGGPRRTAIVAGDRRSRRVDRGGSSPRMEGSAGAGRGGRHRRRAGRALAGDQSSSTLVGPGRAGLDPDRPGRTDRGGEEGNGSARRPPQLDVVTAAARRAWRWARSVSLWQTSMALRMHAAASRRRSSRSSISPRALWK